MCDVNSTAMPENFRKGEFTSPEDCNIQGTHLDVSKWEGRTVGSGAVIDIAE